VELLAAKRANPGGRGRAAAKPLRELGEHPDKGGPVQVFEGRYGPYVKWDKINATLPKDQPPEEITLETATALIAEKAAKKGGSRKKAAPRKKPAASKKAG
jgi:DNA topoisomerase-1